MVLLTSASLFSYMAAYLGNPKVEVHYLLKIRRSSKMILEVTRWKYHRASGCTVAGQDSWIYYICRRYQIQTCLSVVSHCHLLFWHYLACVIWTQQEQQVNVEESGKWGELGDRSRGRNQPHLEFLRELEDRKNNLQHMGVCLVHTTLRIPGTVCTVQCIMYLQCKALARQHPNGDRDRSIESVRLRQSTPRFLWSR